MTGAEAWPLDPIAGALNMLVNCAGAVAGERLLICQEGPELGVYAPGLVEPTVKAAVSLGLSVAVKQVGLLETVDALPANLADAAAEADHCVFFARLGDQLRFKPMPDAARPVVCYALTPAMLGSAFGCLDHRAMVSIKDAIDRMFSGAREIRSTCPLGSDVRGTLAPARGGNANATSVRRFPLSVFSPLDSAAFSGRVALSRFLVGTGSHYYSPYGVPLDDVAFVEIGGGRMLGLSGSARDVAAIRSHYEHVSGLLGIDAGVVHSWHAGIHPGCGYDRPAEASYERWSAGAFGNPRILHFHTCGDYAPGEICWNVIDPTITVDGVAVWEHGVMCLDRIPGCDAVLARYPQAAALFDAPFPEIGL